MTEAYVENNGLRISSRTFAEAHGDWLAWYEAQRDLSKQWSQWVSSCDLPPEEVCRDATLELVERLARAGAVSNTTVDGYRLLGISRREGAETWWDDCDWRDPGRLLSRVIHVLSCGHKMALLRSRRTISLERALSCPSPDNWVGRRFRDMIPAWRDEEKGEALSLSSCNRCRYDVATAPDGDIRDFASCDVCGRLCDRCLTYSSLRTYCTDKDSCVCSLAERGAEGLLWEDPTGVNDDFLCGSCLNIASGW